MPIIRSERTGTTIELAAMEQALEKADLQLHIIKRQRTAEVAPDIPDQNVRKFVPAGEIAHIEIHRFLLAASLGKIAEVDVDWEDRCDGLAGLLRDVLPNRASGIVGSMSDAKWKAFCEKHQ